MSFQPVISEIAKVATSLLFKADLGRHHLHAGTAGVTVCWAGSETSVIGGHFGNIEYMKVIAGRTINKHKQTDTITVVLTTVRLAQACTN